MAGSREDALQAFSYFQEVYGIKYPKAEACLVKDREELLASPFAYSKDQKLPVSPNLADNGFQAIPQCTKTMAQITGL